MRLDVVAHGEHLQRHDHHRTEHVAEAVRDLIKHKLVEERGRTSTIGTTKLGGPAGNKKLGGAGPGEKIFGLTPAGLLAAAEALGDDREIGSGAL
ncbi:hypothetical protein ACFZDG_26895 [Kitasatospora xanthocidica]|uniref:hypothetical protein n=1 Tax=Kitasatospora xanthocidica TaxID=83382 RepID=UPI0036EEB0F3